MLIRSNFLRRFLGCFLAVVGVVLLICFMPFWMWLAVLGAVMICFGCIILKRGYN